MKVDRGEDYGACWRRWGRSVVVPAGLIAVWQAVMVLFDIQTASLAPPSEIAYAAIGLVVDGSLLPAAGETMLAVVSGLLLGCTLGAVAGIFLGFVRIADRLLEFSVEMARPVPPVALIPITLIIFGFGYSLEISIIAFGTLWPVLVLTRDSIAIIEPRLIEVSRLLGFGLLSRMTKIIVPAILPRFFVSFRLAAGIALILAVTVEITINPIGLGHQLMMAGQGLKPAEMLAYVFWIGAIGFALNYGLLAVQRRLFAHDMAGAKA